MIFYGSFRGTGAVLHESLQDKHSRKLINNLTAAPNAHIGFAQHAIGFCGSEALVPKVHRQVEASAHLCGQCFNFLSLCAWLATQVQRIPHHNFSYFVLANQVGQPLQVNALAGSSNGRQALRRYSQRIRHREADSARTDIQSQQPAVLLPDAPVISLVTIVLHSWIIGSPLRIV